jgi:hypothetical protein
MTLGIRGLKPNILWLLVATAAVAGVACGDLTGVNASLPTISDTGTVYALNGAPAGANTAFNVFSGVLLPANASFVFDVAFDIDSSGNVVLLPVSVVATGLSASHQVALQRVNLNFDSLASAPKSGYRADTALVVGVNQTVAIQSTDPTACGTSLTGTTLYGKLVVTAIDPVAKQIAVRFVVDPNCGFFSFASGLPKD